MLITEDTVSFEAGPIIVRSTEHLFYKPLIVALSAFSALLKTTRDARSPGAVPEEPFLGSGVSMCSRFFDCEVSYNPSEVAVSLFKSTWPASFLIQIHQGSRNREMQTTRNAIMELYSTVFEQAYLQFFEEIKEALIEKYGGFKNAPPVIRLCRVIRNAIAHGGCITIKDGLSGRLNGHEITEAQNGDFLTYNHATQADYILLMLVLNQDVGGLGIRQ